MEATNDKQDRSIRVWGADGQKAIVSSHVMLVGADALGSETIKNLVLPGIGYYTVADDHLINEEDVASNFLVTYEQIGQSRAKAVYEFLSELNTDSKGTYIQINKWEDFLQDHVFKDFDTIIISNINPTYEETIIKYCEANNKAVILLRSCALIGYMRIYKPEHIIFDDMNADQKVFLLRLNKPFVELIEFSKKWPQEFKGVDEAEATHVPYAIVLMHVLYKFITENGFRMPGELPKGENPSLAFKIKQDDIMKMTKYLNGKNISRHEYVQWREFL